MDLERATSMIKALPHMSKTIVDDTLYEKVLSYLTLVFSQCSIAELKQLDQTCQLLEQIQQACLTTQDQDYRVTALCIHILGQYIHYGHDNMFDIVQKEYSNILSLIVEGMTSSEAALRCACIECCRLFLSCTTGQLWQIKHAKLVSLIPFTLLDQSSYVVAETSRYYATLIRFDLTVLLDQMDPSHLILSLLQPNADQKQTLSALDFSWEIVHIQQPVALDYLLSKKLLFPLIPLLPISNRMIRSRILEILSLLFSWDVQPLKTLNLNNSDTTLAQAYQVISKLAIDVIKEANVLDEVLTGVSFLNISFILYSKSEKSSIQEAYQTLYSLYKTCLGESNDFGKVKELMILSNRSKNNLLQLVIRTINTLAQYNPDIIISMETFVEFFHVLKLQAYYSDPRTLKAILELLTNTIQEQNVPNSIESIVHIMIDDDTVLDCKSLSIVLSTFENLLGHDSIGNFLIQSGKSFADALCLKFLDVEWDIRDAAIHFVGELFKEPINANKIQFALKYNLPLNVFHRIHDSEPYVKAAAIEVLEKMMKSKEGWDYIQQNQVSRDLASKLPNLLYDTEAFVRRSAIDAIICLVHNRSCQGMKIEIKDAGQQNSLSPMILRKLMNDEDTDVRIKTCTLVENLWMLYHDEKYQQKKHRTRDDFFEHINADELLIDAVNDINRVVRIEAVRVVEHIVEYYDQQKENANKKRLYLEQDEFELEFIAKLNSINLTEKRQTLDPEHLYQEAFDINAYIMTQSIIPKNPDDDINMLDCY